MLRLLFPGFSVSSYIFVAFAIFSISTPHAKAWAFQSVSQLEGPGITCDNERMKSAHTYMPYATDGCPKGATRE